MLANPSLMLTYISLCAIVGYLWRSRAIGFAGVFVLSLVLSPLIMAVVLLVTKPARVKA